MGKIQDSVKQHGYIYLVVIVLATLHIFYLQTYIKNQLINEIEVFMVEQYNLCKKIFDVSSKTRTILVENDNYVDTGDIVDEFSNSTPYYFDKNRNQVNKYSLMFIYYDKSDLTKNDSLKSMVEELGERSHIFKFKDDIVSLFARADSSGYVLINKYAADTTEFQNSISTMFYEMLFFSLVNFIVFYYLIGLIKDSKQTVNQIESMYQKKENIALSLAHIDNLTGAYTRIKLNDELNNLMDIASKFKQHGFGLAMLDIDHFKKVNDTLGHDYGDLVLKSVAAEVKRLIRASDIFARWGGEEFILVFPSVDIKQAVKICEKLRRSIEEIEFDKLEKVTCSFGVIVYEQDTTIEELVKRADLLLYEAKKGGRNRVEYSAKGTTE